MELSNVKLRAALDRVVTSHNKPLAGTVRLEDFEARSLVGKNVNGFLGTFSFVNENEGYHARKISGNYYIITGHWVYGDEEILGSGNVLGHRAHYVITTEPAQRPQLMVVSPQDYAAA